MELINYIWLYLTIGVACAFCFDVLYSKLEMEQATWSERLLWFGAWPIFVLVFLWAIFNDSDE